MMRVKMLILRKSDFDYLLTFYPPPFEHLRDELTDWAEVLRWISLPKVYAKKIRKIAQMTSGNVDAGGSTAGERKASVQRKRLGSVVLNSAVASFLPGGIRGASVFGGMGSARGRGGGDVAGGNTGGDTDRGRRRKSNTGRGSLGEEGEKREINRGRKSSRKELRVDEDGARCEIAASTSN